MSKHVEVDPALWEEFHRVVNMTSRELLDWLRTRSASEETEQFADKSGSQTGRHVVDILQKRRGDVTADDERVMRKVVDRIHGERGVDMEPTAGDDAWRHRMM